MWESVWVNLITAQVEAQPEGVDRGVVDILLEASGVVLGVLVLLALLSLVAWYIIGYKWWYLRRAKIESAKFLEIFWQSKRLDAIYGSAQELGRSPVSQVFKAGYIELSKLKSTEKGEAGGSMSAQLSGIENVERALRRARTAELTALEGRLPFLATVGSNAPFIGLFGTVWGIMIAFMEIASQGAAGIDVVSGPIAEALIVTAVGLLTAIPAGAAYNYFLSQINVLGAEMDNFSDDFLNIIKRHFFK